MKRSLIDAVILVAVLSTLTGCGSSGGGGGSNGGNGNSNNLTQAQAQQLGSSVANDIDKALANAMSNAEVPMNATSRANMLVALRRGSQADTAPKPEGSATLSGTYTCPDGGSIGVAGSFNSTSTSLSGSVTETPHSCSDGTVILNGNPDVTVGVQGNDNGTTATVSITIGGGVSYGPAAGVQFPSGSCSCNVTASASVNDSTGNVTSSSISGSVCGQSVD